MPRVASSCRKIFTLLFSLFFPASNNYIRSLLVVGKVRTANVMFLSLFFSLFCFRLVRARNFWHRDRPPVLADGIVSNKFRAIVPCFRRENSCLCGGCPFGWIYARGDLMLVYFRVTARKISEPAVKTGY